jgi:release factor glutamine methyltransferase
MRISWPSWRADPVRLDEVYKQLKERLRAAGIDQPEREARILIRKIADVGDADFITHGERVLSAETVIALEHAAARRLAGEPPSRIFGGREFWGLPFTVTPDVLDPRHDTETVVETALRIFRDQPPATVLDLGTGSGCLIVSLLHIWPQAKGVAIDVSGAALEVARKNAAVNGVASCIDFRQGSWFEPVGAQERFDLIVANPPYIPESEIATLEPGVRDYDPILALNGGKDGFDSYRIIFSGLAAHFSARGIGLFEIGIGQDADIARLAEEYGIRLRAIHPDLAGIPRVAEIARGDK